MRVKETRRPWRRPAVMLTLVAALCAASDPQLVSAAQAGESQQGERSAAELIEELGHALGMTPEEVAALGLSPAEMEGLLAGFQEETVVVGSRGDPRSVTESSVPVDVLSATDLVRRGGGDLKDQLRTVIPSFNANTQPIQGASTVVRPAMLRNLAPDHTLVLINGKRRHRSSVVEWHGGNGIAYGSQGPDISVIPSIALRQIEVLRDGAAGPVRLGRDRRRDELPAQGRRLGRILRGQLGHARRWRRGGVPVCRQRRPAARQRRIRQPEPGVRQRESDGPHRAAQRRRCAHRGRQHARPLRASADLGQPRHRRRAQAVRQLRLHLARWGPVLRAYELRQQESDPEFLLPQSQHAPGCVQHRRGPLAADRRRAGGGRPRLGELPDGCRNQPCA